jgi:tight adherence protein C
MTQDAADQLILFGLMGASGLSAMVIAWVVSRAASVVPAEDRQYKDPPPLGFRLCWWPTQWLAFYLGPRLRVRKSQSIEARLRAGGLEYALRPAQFVAARVLCGGGAAALTGWLAETFQLSYGVWMISAAGALAGWIYPAMWLRDRIAARRRALLKEIPFFLDMVTLCVEAGLNVQGALHQAASKGPIGTLRSETQRLLRDIRAGKPRADALRELGERLAEPALRSFASSVIQAEKLGANLGPVLRQQADQRRVERFLRAEKMAMEAPVKMLFPLLAFIFPCTFIVLAFPILTKFMAAGW